MPGCHAHAPNSRQLGVQVGAAQRLDSQQAAVVLLGSLVLDDRLELASVERPHQHVLEAALVVEQARHHRGVDRHVALDLLGQLVVHHF